jgi:hypothetical protein
MSEKFLIVVDTVKNRAIAEFHGFAKDDEAVQIADKYIKELSRLKPGFDIIVDKQDAKPGSQVAAEQIKRVMMYCIEHKVNRVIRVVGGAKVAQLQVCRQGRNVGFDASTAATVADAEKLLDGK